MGLNMQPIELCPLSLFQNKRWFSLVYMHALYPDTGRVLIWSTRLTEHSIQLCAVYNDFYSVSTIPCRLYFCHWHSQGHILLFHSLSITFFINWILFSLSNNISLSEFLVSCSFISPWDSLFEILFYFLFQFIPKSVSHTYLLLVNSWLCLFYI